MSAYHDPVGAAEIWRAKREAAIEEFQAGRISEDVFTATLYGLGYRSQELRSELALARPAVAKIADSKSGRH